MAGFATGHSRLSPFGHSGSLFQHNSESYSVLATDVPWLFASGMGGMARCQLPLIDEGQPAASYNVRLYFAALEGDQPGRRVFDIRLQGETVREHVDVLEQAGAARKAVVLEFESIPVANGLAIELVPRSGMEERNQPTISAIEVLRHGEAEIVQRVAQE